MPGHRTNLEDFRAGRLCRIVVEIALQDDEGSPYYLAEASFESNHLIASANADSPAGAFAGAAAAAGELLAREHSAARIYLRRAAGAARDRLLPDEAEAA